MGWNAITRLDQGAPKLSQLDLSSKSPHPPKISTNLHQKRERLKITKSSKFLFNFAQPCWTPLNKNLESNYWMKIIKLKSFKIWAIFGMESCAFSMPQIANFWTMNQVKRMTCQKACQMGENKWLACPIHGTFWHVILFDVFRWQRCVSRVYWNSACWHNLILSCHVNALAQLQ